MSFVEDKQVVEALCSHRLHPSLRNRVRPWCSERRSHLPNAETPQASIEGRPIASVPIVNQKLSWQSIPSAALHYLLGYPLCRRKWPLPRRAGFPGSRAGLQKRHRASETRLFGRRRNRTPICSIHGASKIFANPRTALDRVANSYILRQSSQKP